MVHHMVLFTIGLIILLFYLFKRESRRDELIENTRLEQVFCEQSYRNSRLTWIVIGLIGFMVGIIMFMACHTADLWQYENNVRPDKTVMTWTGFWAWTCLVAGSALFLANLNSFCKHDIRSLKYSCMSDGEYDELRLKALQEKEKEEEMYRKQRNMKAAYNLGQFLGGL